MRQKLRRVIQAMFFSAVGFAVCVAFQNCSGYSAIDSPLYGTESSTTCVGLTCTVDDTLLSISITNDNPSYVKNVATPNASCGFDDSACLDIGGYCDDGGYPDNKISASVTGGTVNMAETILSGVKCVDGRYTTQIKLPAGYDYGTAHVLRITIYGIDSSGQTVTSSAGANYRQLSIFSYTTL